MKAEIITLHVPAGTRKSLASIKKTSGLTPEDIFKLGIRYIVKKAEFETRKALPQVEPPSIILPS
jgi:hypothetical protein